MCCINNVTMKQPFSSVPRKYKTSCGAKFHQHCPLKFSLSKNCESACTHSFIKHWKILHWQHDNWGYIKIIKIEKMQLNFIFSTGISLFSLFSNDCDNTWRTAGNSWKLLFMLTNNVINSRLGKQDVLQQRLRMTLKGVKLSALCTVYSECTQYCTVNHWTPLVTGLVPHSPHTSVSQRAVSFVSFTSLAGSNLASEL